MARREIVLEAGGRKYALRFSCAAAEILDPEGKASSSEIVHDLRRVSFLRGATLAALEGARRASSPATPAFTAADADALIDAAGVQPVADAVTEVYMEWQHPGIDLSEAAGPPGKA